LIPLAFPLYPRPIRAKSASYLHAPARLNFATRLPPCYNTLARIQALAQRRQARVSLDTVQSWTIMAMRSE
jgi:hypothetical protein